ncbi:MAG TPA: aminotransferase class I/II-fold pyridoxal phosphate-dependent enzyme, partial [Chroococcales cyanobacterium]
MFTLTLIDLVDLASVQLPLLPNEEYLMISMNARQSFQKAGGFELTSTARELTPSATLAINEAVAEKQGRGESIIHLGFGQSSMPMHPRLLDALARASNETGYAPVMGLPALRSAVSSYLNRTRGMRCSAQEVAIGPGSKALIYALLQLLDGDLILPRPSWVSYLPQARLAGKQVVWVETSPDDRHRITPEALDEALERGYLRKANPRILLINSPSNPTGCMYDEFEVRAISQWAEAHQITLISDEIYAEVAHGSKRHVSPAKFYPEGCIVTGGMSKAFSAGGWRIGYAVLPATDFGRRLGKALEGLASEVWSCVATPVQKAATLAYSDDLY